MINPSAFGWIDKFFLEQKKQNITATYADEVYYENIRKTGFLFGYITNSNSFIASITQGLTNQELSKVSLLNILYHIFQDCQKQPNSNEFIETCNHFYNLILPKSSNLLQKILPEDSTSIKLEKIISIRIQTNENVLSKNFSHILTNALLFIDVLAFKKYLTNGIISTNYLKQTEEIIVSLVCMALKTKKTKSTYDDLLQKMFETSIRFSTFNTTKIDSLENIPLDFFSDNYEKYYLIDLSIMAMWNDFKIEANEQKFIFELASKLQISESFTTRAISEITNFLTTNKSNIPYFNYTNPVKHFYDQTTKSVQTLIKRNKSRLILEISQSKELMILLAQSTKRDLNEDEKKKVRNQILDICKTIPSLTIFIIPGGSLLLPILIKFIPQLLPSSFNENLNDD